MSAERLSIGFNYLIPETYKSKAEAFAKCLQDKLLSLGKVEAPPEPCNGEPERRASGEDHAEWEVPQSRRKTGDSEEEMLSHSESDHGNFECEKQRQKLASMSSEDSTMDSWSSCQENLTDFERLDSETEEMSSLAAQIKGSPRLKSFNIRAKQKEFREKTWKKNSRRNFSSSTESVDSEGVRQEHGRPTDDLEFGSQFILLDGSEPGDDIPHRVLRESSSTSSLERLFSQRENDRNGFKFEKRSDSDLFTPPSSPNTFKTQALNSRLRFAQIETDPAENFEEAEYLRTPSAEYLSKPVKKVGGRIVECARDDEGVDLIFECPEASFMVTCVEVLQHTPTKCRSADERQPEIDGAEDDEMLNSRSRMRRCSSLKTWKTPPGTPGAKKIVRFADALGLDLADVRTFLDEIPKIPSSAYEDLYFGIPQCENPAPTPLLSALVPSFHQPGTEPNFLERVRNQKICLESTMVTLEGVPTVTGYVRVQNVGYHKSVHVRYTLNDWQTYFDLQATYVPNSCDGFSDRFSFSLYGHTLKIGDKLEFALRLECCGAQYWDNNGGANYVFHCLTQTSSVSGFSSLCTSQPDPWFDFY